MRTRLLVVLVALALAVVAAFAVPLLTATAEQRTQQLVISRTADVDRFVVLAQQAVDTHDPAALAADAERYAQLYGEGVVIVDARRLPLVQAGDLTASTPAVRALVEATMRNEPAPRVDRLDPWSAEPAYFARPVGTGTRVSGVVVLRASVTSAAADVATGWGTIGAGAVLVAMVFVLLAVVLARWMVRPLHELETGVLAVAGGHRAHVPERTGPRELRSLAAEVNRMSEAVLEAAEQQHRLVADASHQLRNPMAALRLRVDSLAGRIDGDDTTYRATVAEVERLEKLLDGLLALALAESTATRVAAGGADEACDLASVLAERVDAWRPAAEDAGSTIVPPPGHDEPVIVRCPEGELAQILDVLLDNAVHYAGRGAKITTDWESGTSAATLVVSDNGPGLSEQDRARATERFWRAGGEGAPRGTGLGLAIAHQQVRTRGGVLDLRQALPHGLEVRVTLPLREVPG
ncbi:two-component system histidine kinase [Amycolatopsis mediterranei S699]|uniref:histidine kinase n=2 Tax=Amycolatopsis mediterranei TaxID=33910 RepID=A0A0H3D6S3_AMYMU|nr:HAMP domain-containing sensor histidine kinase [Amycolatopsis mediterranei]ADJ46710.1 two-component system histidine kinase [Amycolatopsis mediterranei U32]AEK43512.1 two-component system histidine kinase [Amycolatopsis mediterranei S699]AFO78421.1 two-component system histidine kinase [Amycolatopsis mediterranei S699]AGT85549.1 two-component system histidine kinase [Amycolatopsis mediterranei RB]KDO11388.1 histidine kinase [Amycolatopsis mediterranei]